MRTSCSCGEDEDVLAGQEPPSQDPRDGAAALGAQDLLASIAQTETGCTCHVCRAAPRVLPSARWVRTRFLCAAGSTGTLFSKPAHWQMHVAKSHGLFPASAAAPADHRAGGTTSTCTNNGLKSSLCCPRCSCLWCWCGPPAPMGTAGSAAPSSSSSPWGRWFALIRG